MLVLQCSRGVGCRAGMVTPKPASDCDSGVSYTMVLAPRSNDLLWIGRRDGNVRITRHRVVMVLCDPRLLSKSSGRPFLAGLPDMPRSDDVRVVQPFFPAQDAADNKPARTAANGRCVRWRIVNGSLLRKTKATLQARIHLLYSPSDRVLSLALALREASRLSATTPEFDPMVSIVRYNLLASAVAVALIGSTMSPVVHAQNLDNATSSAAAQSEISRYIITFNEPGALYYTGGVSGIKGTAPDAVANGDRKFHANSPDAVAYRSFLRDIQTNRIADLSSLLGHTLDVSHRYEITMNGIAADLTAAEAGRVSRAPGVKSITREQIYHTDTFRGPTFIGAPTIWNAPTPGGNINRGKGVVVGVLDSGVNSTNPSFADEASCNYTGAEKKLLSAVDCSVVTAGVCAGPNPEAVDSGHGVHTASTAAGAVVTNAASPSPALPAPYTQLSGVAPCASLRTYKVCPGSTCPGADIIGGVDSAIADGVDVINFSISGGTSPWNDNDRNFLDALNADILVAASAGNTRAETPNPVGNVNHRGPWVMTVAASTQDVNIGAGLSATGPGTPPANTQNILTQTGSNTPAVVPFASSEIRYNAANPVGCTATGGFPAGFFAGSVALIPRGACSFAEKVTNAGNAGATAAFIYNNTFGTINMNTDGAIIPSYSMTQAAGQNMLAFITTNGATPTTVKLESKIAGPVQGDVLADFSFRGPTPGNLADLTKPDITGPGVNVLAAGRVADGNFFTISGTSMSAPHLAGSAALIRAVQPGWTPTEVKSALMMTAKIAGFKENGTDSWNVDDVGNGRVDLNFAAKAGLVMNETGANFLAANPVGGTINVKELNLPSVRNMTCTPDCTFTRTVKSTLSTSANWTTSFMTVNGVSATVTPAAFTIAPGASQVLTIKVMPTGAPIIAPAVGFGHIMLTTAGGASPVEHISVAVRGTGDVIFANGFDSDTPPAGPLVDEYTNRVITNATGGVGGAPVSELQTALGLTTLGAGAQIANNNSVAEDFTVPAGGWTITRAKFYTYQSFAGPVSTINDVRIQVFTGTPTGTPVFGDTTTNRLTSTVATGGYRAATATITNGDRAIYEVVADFSPAITLPAGTHWIAWNMGGTAASGPWAIPQTVLGTASTGNCQQSLAGAAFAPLIDGGTSAAALGCAFVLEGTAP